MYRKQQVLSYHLNSVFHHSAMNHDDESTQSLLDGNEKAEIEIEDTVYVRHKREPVKMIKLLPYILAFALVVTFVYGVRYSDSDKVYTYTHYNKSNSSWTYDCIENQCIRRLVNIGEISIPVEKCNMVCGTPSLWPKPKSVVVNKRRMSTFRKNLVSTKINANNQINDDLQQAVDLFIRNLPTEDLFWLEDVDLTNIFITINVSSSERKPHVNTDESYSMIVKKVTNHVDVNIAAKTYFGARHSLETLSQLISLDENSGKLQIYHDIEIRDLPSFAHRGLMVDTARNFFPIEQLLRVLDGMAMNKLNVFHLHLTDAVSFPIELPSNPWLAKYGAYGPDMIYKPSDIKDLIEYARIRGIRVILEIDTPSHVNEGWNHWNTKNEKLIICGEDDVLNGHLNPDNNKTLKLVQSIYEDLIDLGSDDETFHIGGDEVNLACLRQTNAARKFSDTREFWADYVNKIIQTVTQAFKNNSPTNLVIWSSDLTDSFLESIHYSKNLVIQYWFGRLDTIVENGNKIIFSTVGKWYLDCGFGSWKPGGTHGSCDPYTPWQTFYNYRPWQSYGKYKEQVLGGEACLWSEQVGVDTLETRIWPRTAALAERLWSDLPIMNLYDVSTRISDQRQRLIRRGFKTATVWPKWCSLNPGKC